MKYICSMLLLIIGVYISYMQIISPMVVCFGLLIVFLVLFQINAVYIDGTTSDDELLKLLSYRRFLFIVSFMLMSLYSLFLLYLVRWTYAIGEVELSMKYLIGLTVAILVSIGILFRK